DPDGCIGAECAPQGGGTEGGPIWQYDGSTGYSGNFVPLHSVKRDVARSDSHAVVLPSGVGGGGSTIVGPAEPTEFGGPQKFTVKLDAEAASQPWRQEQFLGFSDGLLMGTVMGSVPVVGLADDVLTTAKVVPKGSQATQIGKAIGKMLGGFFLAAGGVGGEVL